MRAWPSALRFGAAVVVGALALAACTSNEGSARGDAGGPLPIASPSSETSSAPATSRTEGGLVLVLRDEYIEGTRIKVRLRNEGSEPFIYNTEYEACEMTFLDASGRKFLIPPGTHCDIIAPAEIEPDTTVTLFMWKLDECVKDEWGCQKERPLPPGSYTVRGSLEGADSGEKVRVAATFEIVPGDVDPVPSPSSDSVESDRSPDVEDGGGGGAERRT